MRGLGSAVSQADVIGVAHVQPADYAKQSFAAHKRQCKKKTPTKKRLEWVLCRDIGIARTG
ncbi:MAG: hypothetical protein CL920_24160 [Deltaproteobacteria bacterium]|nr:hypothetical protein [Deltaproteobacteria bacterium]